MRTDTVAKPRIAEGKKQVGLDSILLYNKKFYYPKTPHIQYLDNYNTDFVFVYDFPKVMEAMSKKLDKQNFREMLRTAVRTNLKLYNDGELLRPDAERLIKHHHYGFLLNNFLGEESDKYIIRGDNFKGNSISEIKEYLSNTSQFVMNKVLPKIKSKIDYHTGSDKDFMQWLIGYARINAMSGKYS
jgi:hypothetical protein